MVKQGDNVVCHILCREPVERCVDRQPGTPMSPAVHQNHLKIGQKRAQKWVKDGKGLAVSMQDKERCAAAVLFIVDFCAGEPLSACGGAVFEWNLMDHEQPL